MTRQVLNRGIIANDGTGDTLRTASLKIEQNFVELYKFLGGDSDVLSLELSLENDALVFGGATNDNNETRLKVADPTADRVITLPNATGTVVLENMTQTLTNKTLTTPSLTTPKITGNIEDESGNEVIVLDNATNANAEVTISSSASG